MRLVLRARLGLRVEDAEGLETGLGEGALLLELEVEEDFLGEQTDALELAREHVPFFQVEAELLLVERETQLGVVVRDLQVELGVLDDVVDEVLDLLLLVLGDVVLVHRLAPPPRQVPLLRIHLFFELLLVLLLLDLLLDPAPQLVHVHPQQHRLVKPLVQLLQLQRRVVLRAQEPVEDLQEAPPDAGLAAATVDHDLVDAALLGAHVAHDDLLGVLPVLADHLAPLLARLGESDDAHGADHDVLELALLLAQEGRVLVCHVQNVHQLLDLLLVQVDLARVQRYLDFELGVALVDQLLRQVVLDHLALRRELEQVVQHLQLPVVAVLLVVDQLRQRLLDRLFGAGQVADELLLVRVPVHPQVLQNQLLVDARVVALGPVHELGLFPVLVAREHAQTVQGHSEAAGYGVAPPTSGSPPGRTSTRCGCECS